MNSKETSETFALRVLAALAENESLRDAFLGSSGLAADEISARVSDPEFLGFVLDFVLQGDEAIVELSQALGAPPERFVEARAALPGGDTPHWT